MTLADAESRALDALRAVVDPELGVNVVDLGLVYGVTVVGSGLEVALTMTSPACPMGEMVRNEAEAAVRRAVPEALHVRIDLVWDPPWEPTRMTEAARRQLGWDA